MPETDNVDRVQAMEYRRIRSWVLQRNPDLTVNTPAAIIVDRLFTRLSQADQILSGKFNQVLIDKIGALVTELVEGGRKP